MLAFALLASSLAVSVAASVLPAIEERAACKDYGQPARASACV
jgi:hypothetical protein